MRSVRGTCGIVQASADNIEPLVGRRLAVQRHRGADAEGWFAKGGGVITQNRLAIIGLVTGDSQRYPARPRQRSARRPQPLRPPDQPPQLLVPLAQAADRADLPLLRRRHHPAPRRGWLRTDPWPVRYCPPARQSRWLRFTPDNAQAGVSG